MGRLVIRLLFWQGLEWCVSSWIRCFGNRSKVSTKPEQDQLATYQIANVLHRPVEVATQSGRWQEHCESLSKTK